MDSSTEFSRLQQLDVLLQHHAADAVALQTEKQNATLATITENQHRLTAAITELRETFKTDTETRKASHDTITAEQKRMSASNLKVFHEIFEKLDVVKEQIGSFDMLQSKIMAPKNGKEEPLATAK